MLAGVPMYARGGRLAALAALLSLTACDASPGLEPPSRRDAGTTDEGKGNAGKPGAGVDAPDRNPTADAGLGPPVGAPSSGSGGSAGGAPTMPGSGDPMSDDAGAD
jgi:hypothetical protein